MAVFLNYIFPHISFKGHFVSGNVKFDMLASSYRTRGALEERSIEAEESSFERVSIGRAAEMTRAD